MGWTPHFGTMGLTGTTVRTHHHQKEGVHMKNMTRMGIDLAKHVFRILLEPVQMSLLRLFPPHRMRGISVRK